MNQSGGFLEETPVSISEAFSGRLSLKELMMNREELSEDYFPRIPRKISKVIPAGI